MKKLAIVHPSFGFAGAEYVAVRVADALKGEFRADLIVTEKGITVDRINEVFGTSLSREDLNIITLSAPQRGHILKKHIAMRFIKKNRTRWDILFSTRDEMDLGRKGIQYIHCPTEESYRNDLGLLRKIYYSLARLYSGYSRSSMKRNNTITSSLWGAGIVKRLYGIESTVIYPPVDDDFPAVPWMEKKESVICAGRIAPEKKIEDVIGIVEKTRILTGKDMGLRLIGHLPENGYGGKIGKLIASRKWIEHSDVLPRKEYKHELSRHRYAVHAMSDEHFGIAVAEYVCAGCLVLIKEGGGQQEIIGHMRELTYGNIEDATDKLSGFVKDPVSASGLRDRLRLTLPLSAERFSRDIRIVVGGFNGQ